MSCEGCIQQIKAAHDQENKTYQDAISLAIKTGQWVVIYKDGFGQQQYCLATESAGLPVTRHISPKL